LRGQQQTTTNGFSVNPSLAIFIAALVLAGFLNFATIWVAYKRPAASPSHPVLPAPKEVSPSVLTSSNGIIPIRRFLSSDYKKTPLDCVFCGISYIGINSDTTWSQDGSILAATLRFKSNSDSVLRNVTASADFYDTEGRKLESLSCWWIGEKSRNTGFSKNGTERTLVIAIQNTPADKYFCASEPFPALKKQKLKELAVTNVDVQLMVFIERDALIEFKFSLITSPSLSFVPIA
jgi:hypothetical protein